MKRGILDSYHIKDARQLLSILRESKFIDTTITSPPYWNLKDYGSDSQVGFGQEYNEYLDDLGEIFSAVHHVTKTTGSLWIVADTIKHNGELKLFPFDLANRLKECGWILHDIIVWHKDKTLPWSHRGKLRNIFEYILFFSKGKNFKYYLPEVREIEGLKEWWRRYPERYSPKGRAPTRTWSIPIPRQGSWGENWVRHFCPFPPELVRRIVLLTTRKGDVVLDPFAGSGVVLAQAKALKRRFVGFDLRTAYRRMFEKTVLPSIVALESKHSRTRLAKAKGKRLHSASIWQLRKTKYPHELFRLYQKHHGRLDARGIIAIAQRHNRVRVFIVFPANKKRPRSFVSRLQALMAKPPLSKYGLRVEVFPVLLIGDSASIIKKCAIRGEAVLRVYENGRTYRAGSSMTAAQFLDSLRDTGNRKKNRVPPIASNIRVKVSPTTMVPMVPGEYLPRNPL
jgi:DNA modification methylase